MLCEKYEEVDDKNQKLAQYLNKLQELTFFLAKNVSKNFDFFDNYLGDANLSRIAWENKPQRNGRIDFRKISSMIF